MISFIPFDTFKPDGGVHGPDLQKAENAIWVNGGWAPIQKKLSVSSVEDGPVTGAYVYMYPASRAQQNGRPDADTAPGIWLPAGVDPGTKDADKLYDKINETNPGDAKYIFAGGAPTAEVVKLSLSDGVAPGSTADHFLKWRYSIPVTTGAWTLKAELLEGTTVRATDTATGSVATSGFVQRSYTLTAGEAGAITDFANLFVRFTATVPGATQYARPDEDIALNGWTDQAGGVTDIFQSIDESSPSDADYVKSPPLVVSGAAYKYSYYLDDTKVDPIKKTGWVLRTRYKGANAGVKITITLKQDTITIKTIEITSASTSFTTNVTTLTAEEATLVTDLELLSVEIETSLPATVTSTVAQNARPSTVASTSGWTVVGAANDAAAIGESSPSDSEYIYTAAGGLPGGVSDVNLSAVSDPQRADGHKIIFRASSLDATPRSVTVQLYEGLSLRATAAGLPSLTGTPTTYTYNLTGSEANSITDYSVLRLVITAGTDNVAVYYATFEVPEVARALVSFSELEIPSPSRAAVSWMTLQYPDPDTSYKGDVSTVFAGVNSKIYEVDESAWNDLSKGGGYGTGSVRPAAWQFCSYGPHVIATNRVDEVQWREDNTGDFKDLIASATKLKARFCATVRTFLFLGDINYSGYQSDDIAWANPIDATDFDGIGSGYIPLRDTPGQVMGLVGGDALLVFKRHAIHRISFTGGDTVFRNDVITRGTGTPFPRSIVVGPDGLVYFWGGDSFYRTSGNGEPERIGSDVLSNFLNSRFSDSQIKRYEPPEIALEDQIMIGACDAQTGILWWIYYSDSSNGTYHHTKGVIYNPHEDKWSHHDIDGLNASFLAQFPNVSNSNSNDLRGIIGFDFSTGRTVNAASYFRFSDPNTYISTFKNKSFTLGWDESNDRPRIGRIKAVLPILTFQPSGSVPEVQVTVVGANDPNFTVEVSQSYVQSMANDYGFFPNDVSGCWFNVQVKIPSQFDASYAAFRGVWVQWENAGSAT